MKGSYKVPKVKDLNINFQQLISTGSLGGSDDEYVTTGAPPTFVEPIDAMNILDTTNNVTLMSSQLSVAHKGT